MKLKPLIVAMMVGVGVTACVGGSDSQPAADKQFPSLASANPADAEPPAADNSNTDTTTGDTGSSTGGDGSTGDTTSGDTTTGSGGVAYTCPSDGSLYFCDDFEDGTYDDSWNALIDTYGLPDPGVFDILDEGDAGKSLRFTAGTRGGTLDQGELILVKPEAFANVPGDYFLEYRIRPRQNGNTGNKYLYGMARYQNPLQWYFGGLNVQNASTSTQVELGYATSEGVSRDGQVKAPIELGTTGGVDGTWYTVRLDVVGNQLTVYLDGTEVKTWIDGASQYNDAGLIGFFTYNRSFEVDYVKVGDPTVKPVQLSLDATSTSYVTAVGGDNVAVNVTAFNSEGAADTFSVASTDESVVTVSVSGNQVTVTPVGEGQAFINFISGSDSSVQRSLAFTVESAWEMPAAVYSGFDSLVTPAPNATEVLVDQVLSVTFDSAPELGTTGEVRIFDYATGELVDRIKVAGEVNELGYPGQDKVRSVNTKLIWVEGDTLHIKPHNHVLEAGKQYSIAIGTNVVSDTAMLGGSAFTGVGEAQGWLFTTSSALPAANSATVVVDDDGSADFRTIQGALDWAMQHTDAAAAVTVTVKAGTYNELLFLRNKSNLSIIGEGREVTHIRAENYESLNSGSGASAPAGGNPSGGRGLFLVEGGDMLTLQDLSITNTHRRTGSGDQAETIYFNSTLGRLIARDAAFYSEQDTLLVKGYNWFYNSIVAGNVDFIWGYPVATVFENSEIRSLGDSKSTTGTSSGGYLLQARVPDVSYPGFVFLNSTLTHAAGPAGVTIDTGTTYLARSSGQSTVFDNIAFVNTKMDDHIASIGWAYKDINGQPAPNPSVATADAGWREYGSMDLSGAPLDISQRCDSNGSCYELSADEVADRFCNRAQIFASFNNGEGWDPYPEDTTDDSCAVSNGSDSAFKAYDMFVGDSSQSSATQATGTIVSQSADAISFTASAGKFETYAQSFFLAGDEVTGDFVYTAKIKSVGDPYAANQFPLGIMLCECDSLAGTTSPLAHVGVRLTNAGWVAQYGHVLADGGGWGKADGDVVTPEGLVLRMVRTGQTYSAYVSTDDGVNYTQLGSNTFTDLPDTVKLGLFAAPYYNDQSFEFEAISLEQSAPIWSASSAFVGDSTQSSAKLATGTVDAESEDAISFTASDGKFETMAQSFFHAAQEVTGDFAITARVAAVGTPYAANQFPFGLMLCECDSTSGTTSPMVHVGMHLTGSGWVSQYGHILKDGSGWGKASGSDVIEPVGAYLKLERIGQTYNAYISTDGGWNYVKLGSNTFEGLPDTVNVGVFAAPYNADQSYAFDNINITEIAPVWSTAGLLVGDSSQSSAKLASGTVLVESESMISFKASDGKFESQAMSFFLASQDVSGDFEISAELKTVGAPYAANQFPVGLMLCECDTASGQTSPLAHVGVRLTSAGWVSQYGHVLSAGSSWGKADGSAVTPEGLFLKLRKVGSSYEAFVSLDSGSTYTKLGGGTFTGLAESLKVGVFAAPYYTEQLFEFANISISAVAPEVASLIPYSETFEVASDTFFTNAYRDITGQAGSDTPMYYAVYGTADTSAGTLLLNNASGARVSIGNTTPDVNTTAGDTVYSGVLDLSKPYEIAFTLVKAAGNETKKFQVYVDNNTSSSANSVLGSASRIYSETIGSLSASVGQVITIKGLVASETSFLTLRTESEAEIEIDNLTISYSE